MRAGSSGFSLVELVVVVAILGVLASIAIPSYDLMVLNARGTEAKGMLSGIYAGEMAFSSEFGAYTARLDAIGFSANGVMHYNFGFWPDSGPPPADAPQGTDTCIQTCPPISICPNTTWTCDMSSAGFQLDGSVTQRANNSNFLAGAHAHWQSDPAKGESFFLDEDKQLTHLPIGAGN